MQSLVGEKFYNMCGIVGAIGSVKWNTEKMLSSIAHRGPDSQGCFMEENVFFGHTRLSIQDLSENGNQPMFSHDRRYVIVFNGEIYNHAEIRKGLNDEFEFRSTGDTETILNAYIKYGPPFLNMMNGIFAFAIYDRKENEIFIARDQMGVKPLYIYQDEDCFLFSSEVKAFLTCRINKELSPQAFANYLSLLWSPGKLTPFKNVQKLLPGQYLKFYTTGKEFKKAKPVNYYQPKFTGEYSSSSEGELIDLLEEKLLTAVKRQMLSDVPVGFFLSGGLDSSLIVAMAKKLYPSTRFPCFTIDIDSWSDEEDFEKDIHYARKVAAYLDVELNVVNADVKIVESFDKMIWHLDEPQADAAPINVLNIAALARKKGIKVLLGGAGGDDLFSGYRRHQALRYEKYFRLFPAFLAKFSKGIIDRVPISSAFFRRLRKLVNNLDKSTDQRMAGYFSWLQSDTANSLFSKEWQNRLRGFNPQQYLIDLNNDIPKEKDLLNRMLYWEMRSFLVDHNLNYTDKMSMAEGVEARVPFLDVDVVDFSLSIPPELKMNKTETKYLLKKVAERYLPSEVIYRPKTGFGAPVRKWIVSDMDEMIKERLSLARVERMGIFDYKKVWELIDANKTGKVDASYSIWAILAIDSWVTQFCEIPKTSI